MEGRVGAVSSSILSNGCSVGSSSVKCSGLGLASLPDLILI